jgi:ABC-2 type transport system permease protein
MNDVLASEALKLRTFVLPRAVLALGAALSGVIGYAVVRIADDQGDTVTLAQVALGPAQPMWFLATIVAVLATAGEMQHRTIFSTFLQVPRRGRVLAAKVAVAAIYGAVLAVRGTVVAVLTAGLSMRSYGMPAELTADGWSTVTASALLGALWAMLAAGLGVLVRNSTVALVSILLWKFVAEQVIPLVTDAPQMRRWMPSGAADAVLYDGAGSRLLEPLAGGLLFAGYAAAIILAGSLLFLRRDPA